jgi:hypothetical protein
MEDLEVFGRQKNSNYVGNGKTIYASVGENVFS